ncbi:MAG: hypothetical protein QF440_00960, partial [Candidatus Thalassarchaeaceae archaeon]|nr:hypothetical protein [Candidatus Thalassarchaeaceae archaeon]
MASPSGHRSRGCPKGERYHLVLLAHHVNEEPNRLLPALLVMLLLLGGVAGVGIFQAWTTDSIEDAPPSELEPEP